MHRIAIFALVALALSAASVSGQACAGCNSGNAGTVCPAIFPSSVSNAPGTSYACGGGSCAGSNDGSGLGFDADSNYRFRQHGSCFPLDLASTSLGTNDEFFFSQDRYNVIAAPGTCGGGHVFHCANCWQDCSGVDDKWVTNEVHKMTFHVVRDMSGVPQSATLTGSMINTGSSGATATVSCSFSSFVASGDQNYFKRECGATKQNSAEYWSVFDTFSCQITFSHALDSMGEMQTVTFEKVSGERGLQVGTHRASLKDGVSNSVLGASTWLMGTGVSGMADNNACRVDSSAGTFDLLGKDHGETVDFNFNLEPVCTWSCDPTGTITGDPHLTGFLGQKMNLLGEDGHVYNMISSPHLQYNVRLNQTRYMVGEKHASLIGEMGLRVGEHQMRIYFPSPEAEEIAVEVDGARIMPGNNEPVLLNEDGSEWIMRTPRARSVLVVTRDYHFNVEGKLHQFRHLDDGVHLVNWVDGRNHHGMLGQTASPEKADKGTKEIVVDYEWPTFLDGSLADYDVAGGDVFGTDYTYSQFDASA